MREKIKTFPRFKTLDDEVRYWNTHSIAKHWDDLEDADLKLRGVKSDNWLLIHMDNRAIKKLNQAAHKKRKTIQKLAQQWIHSLAS